MKRDEVTQETAAIEAGLPTATDEEVDKRRHARIPVSVSAEVIDAKTHVRVPGRATDIGVGGCYVDAMNTFAEGSQVQVALHWRGQTLQLHALVSYVVNGRSIGMGLAFTATSAHQGATLLDWLTGRDGTEPARHGKVPSAPAAAKVQIADPSGTGAAIEELVALLVRKQLLTASEGARICDQLTRKAVKDAT